MQMGFEKHRDFRSISHIISETIQDRVIATVKRQKELVCTLSDNAISRDLE